MMDKETVINWLNSYSWKSSDPAVSEEILENTSRTLQDGLPPEKVWEIIRHSGLDTRVGFKDHLAVYRKIFKNVAVPLAWLPSREQLGNHNLTAMMKKHKLADFQALQQWSVNHYPDFWREAIEALGIRFRINPEASVVKNTDPTAPTWLPGASMNIADSCFQADPGKTAIITQAPDSSLGRMTYGELNRLSNRVANGLTKLGIMPGDAVAVHLPMHAESVAVYLGIIKAGCAAVSIADSFSSPEIRVRLEISGAKLIFTQTAYLRGGKTHHLHERVQEAADLPAVVLGEKDTGRLRSQDLNWAEFLPEEDAFEAVPCAPETPANILFSSGTTGSPKAIPWTHTTPIKCAVDAWAHMDIQPNDRLAWPTNLGWMMGPWLIFATLINRSSMALFPDVPTKREFGTFIEKAEVTFLGLIPSIVKDWRRTDCMAGLNWKRIKGYGSTGESSHPEDMLYLMYLADYKPVIEYCGGTEIGGAYITGSMILGASPGTFSTEALGSAVLLRDGDGHPASPGEVFLSCPSIGYSNTLLNKDHYAVYFKDTPRVGTGPPLRRHGDQMEKLPNGYYRALGRADNTMNLGGIKTSSTEIERALMTLHGVKEVAATGVTPPGGGPQKLVVFAVLPENTRPVKDLKKEFQQAINQKLNPLFRISDLVLTDALPRTASQKVIHRTLRDRYTEQQEVTQ